MLDIDKLLEDVRNYNIGKSDYSKHKIQPWDVWLSYPELTPWDHDIIKRVLRTKEDTPREEDYTKIIHDCLERIRQLRTNNNEISKIDYLDSEGNLCHY